MKKEQTIQRIKWDFKENVEIPTMFKIYLWEYKEQAPLEMLIKRVLQYGSFDEIKRLYEMFPEQTYTVTFKYPEIKRGIRFWIKRWKNSLV
ncbi:MAG: hypothetical protein HXY47_07125 [Nitrospirae bacterium]|nr:hypothetical protein [Nitrospirota bacterium]